MRTSRRIVVATVLVTAMSFLTLPAGANEAPIRFDNVVVGPLPAVDNPCTGETGLTVTFTMDVMIKSFVDATGNRHFFRVAHGTAEGSDGTSGPVHATEAIQQEDIGGMGALTSKVTDGTNTYIVKVVNLNDEMGGFVMTQCVTPQGR